jgi:hypothetical protein
MPLAKRGRAAGSGVALMSVIVRLSPLLPKYVPTLKVGSVTELKNKPLTETANVLSDASKAASVPPLSVKKRLAVKFAALLPLELLVTRVSCTFVTSNNVAVVVDGVGLCGKSNVTVFVSPLPTFSTTVNCTVSAFAAPVASAKAVTITAAGGNAAFRTLIFKLAPSVTPGPLMGPG